MKCQRCGTNEAKISYTQRNQDESMVLYVCEKCAQAIHITPDTVENYQELSEWEAKKDVKNPLELVCPYCGTTFEDFAKSGMFGCEKCSLVFGNRLDNPLRRNYRVNQPKEIPQKSIRILRPKKMIKKMIEKLKGELKQCIQEGDEKKAILISKQIKALERELFSRERGE